MRKKLQKVIIPAALWVAVWAIWALRLNKPLLLPTPWAVLSALGEMAGTGAFWRSALVSLGRFCLGFLLGAALGSGLGVATALSRWCDTLLSPALRGVRTVPVVSFILLLYFSLPTAWIPVAVAALMALPVVWRACRQGMDQTDPALLEAADNYRLGLGRKLRLIYIPSALPALAGGWETALGLAWKSGVAAEVLCQPKWALGTGLQSAKTYLDAPGLFAWTVAIVALSLATEGLLKLALRPWKGGEGA